jgi:hypothetical protein
MQSFPYRVLRHPLVSDLVEVHREGGLEPLQLLEPAIVRRPLLVLRPARRRHGVEVHRHRQPERQQELAGGCSRGAGLAAGGCGCCGFGDGGGGGGGGGAAAMVPVPGGGGLRRVCAEYLLFVKKYQAAGSETSELIIHPSVSKKTRNDECVSRPSDPLTCLRHKSHLTTSFREVSCWAISSATEPDE